MDFDFSDEQEQLRDAVRKWVDKGYTFDRRRDITNAGGFDRAAYTELAELGLCGLYISEDQSAEELDRVIKSLYTHYGEAARVAGVKPE